MVVPRLETELYYLMEQGDKEMLISRLNSTRISELLGKIDTVLIPVGTFEAHGPHASVMTDSIWAEKACEEVDKFVGDRVFVAPLIPYGHTLHLKEKPGSLDIPAQVLSDYVFEILKGFFLSWQIKFAVIVNGHHDQIGALRLAAERAHELGLKIVILNWWLDPFWSELKNVAPELEGHAGAAETSMIWYIGEEYVETELIPKKPHSFSFNAPIGLDDTFSRKEINSHIWPMAYFGNPSGASKEIGKALFEKSVQLIIKSIDLLRDDRLIRS